MKRLSYLGGNILAAIAVLVSLSAFNPGLVAAATPATVPTSSSAISINPRVNAIVDPGQTEKGSLTIGNLDGTAPLDLTLRVIDFSYTNETGVAKLFVSKTAPQTTWSLKPYLKIPTSVTVPAGQIKTISYSISIPSDLGAGSYYSAIEYASGLGDGGNVGLSASGVTLVFVSVPGNVHEKLTLEKFGAYAAATDSDAGHFTSFLTTSAPKMLGFTVKNSGNVVESPAGSIVLDKWGHHYKTIASVNPESLLSLIGQTRLYTPCIKSQTSTSGTQTSGGVPTSPDVCVKSGLSPGHYTAKLEIYYGQNGNPTQEVIGTASFWYIPTWLLILIIIVILIIIFVLWLVYKKIRQLINPASRPRGSSRSYSYRLQMSKRFRRR